MFIYEWIFIAFSIILAFSYTKKTMKTNRMEDKINRTDNSNRRKLHTYKRKLILP